MATASVVKQTAKTALKDNWFKGIVAAAVFMFAFFAVYIAIAFLGTALPDIAANIIWALLIFYLLGPLLLGMLRYFWRIMWDCDDSISVLFHYFSSKQLYLRAAKLMTAFLVKILWIGFLLMIPAFLTDIFSSVEVYELFGMSAPSWTSNLWILSVFFKSAAVVLLFAVMLKFYLAPFLVIADEEMDIWEAMHKSTVLSRATSLDFVFLILSFIGWILLSVTVIPLIFTVPYFAVAYLVHSRFATASYNKVVKEWNSAAEQNSVTA